MPRIMPPLLLLAWFLSSFLLVLSGFWIACFLYGLFVLVISFFFARSISIIWIILKWWLPFSIPLVLIHSVINPQHEVTFYAFSYIPIRFSGLQFSATILAKIWLITVVGASMAYGERNTFINFLLSYSFPTKVVIIYSQALSSIDTLSRQIHVSFEAQKARGIETEGNLYSRLMALPRVIVPVVLSSLVDSDMRALHLENRGLSKSRWVTNEVYVVTSTEVFFVVISLFALFVSVIPHVY